MFSPTQLKFGCLAIAATGLVFIGSGARADTVGIEAAAQVGSDSLAGAPTANKQVTSEGLLINLWSGRGEAEPSVLGGLSGYFSLALTNLGTATARTSDFPLTPNEGYTMTRTTLSPTICALSNMWARVCLGVGYGVLTVSQPDNLQNYGTFLWTLNVQHHFQNHITVGIGTEFDEVDMTVNNRNSSFENWNNFLTVGYMF